MQELNIENWSRKSQYHFFKTYEDPFFNITTNLEVTNLYNFCKKNELSFSLSCLYVAIKNINEIPEFKLRIKNGKIYQFNSVNIGSTVLNDDNTFSFCDFPMKQSIFDFVEKGTAIIKAHREGVVFNPQENELAIIHCSTMPWFSFTAIKHARKGDEAGKGIPKLVFGKYFTENEIMKIPFSVEVHHALMDGFHVALLLDKMQQFINDLA